MSTKELKSKIECDMEELGQNITAPILLPFVQWILFSCAQRGIKRIYFLARDGYILKSMAESICKNSAMDFDFRYLYCSRYSLRLPLYHLIEEEAINQITCSAIQNTPEAVFKRIGLTEDEMRKIMTELSVECSVNKPLTNTEYKSFCDKLKNSENFLSFVNEKSQAAFPNTVLYLQQEGLFDDVDYAIVDSGWSGSMQRSLRQILDFAGCKKRMIGYYFGMLVPPLSQDDGEYNTFYFNAESPKSIKIKFCCNLFECMLAAPHNMTIGYEKVSGMVNPIFQEGTSDKQISIIKAHQSGIMKFADQAQFVETFDFKSIWKTERKMVARIMMYPTRREAECFGSLLFCDDLSGANVCALASKKQIELLKNYSIIRRVLRKIYKALFGRDKYVGVNLFWPYGTIAFAPSVKQSWYRLNVYVGEWLRLVLKKH